MDKQEYCCYSIPTELQKDKVNNHENKGRNNEAADQHSCAG